MDIKTSNKLYELRKAKGYSQDELADLLNVSRQAVSKWERAESSPDTDNLIALAKLYDISIDDLLDYKPSNKPNFSTEQSISNGGGNFANQSEDDEASFDNKADDATDGESQFHREFNTSCNNKDNSTNADDFDCTFDNPSNDDDAHDFDDVLDGAFDDDDDGDCHIRINQSGIHMRMRNKDDDKEKDCDIHIDENGLHVHKRETDDKQTEYTEKHIFKPFDDDESPKPLIPHVASVAINSSIIILSVIAYLLLGILGGWWHPAWIVFLAIPIFGGMLDAISKRNPDKFPFAVLVTALYLLLGFLGGWWHPAWIVFLFIPIYHILAEALYKAHKKKADDCQNKSI